MKQEPPLVLSDAILFLSLISAVATGVVSGFIWADWRDRRRLEGLLDKLASDWRGTLTQVQAVHNTLVGEVQSLSDRMSAIDMVMRKK